MLTYSCFLDYETPLPGSSPTLHQIFMIVAGGATLINIVITSYLIQGHVRHWTKPNEQKQCVQCNSIPLTEPADQPCEQMPPHYRVCDCSVVDVLFLHRLL